MQEKPEASCNGRNFTVKSGQIFQHADVRDWYTIMQNAYKKLFLLKGAGEASEAKGALTFPIDECNIC